MSGGQRFEIIFPKKIGDRVKPFSFPQEKLLDTDKPIFLKAGMGPR